MDLFADDGVVAELEARYLSAGDAVDPELLLELAWQMRQRDTARALALVDSAQASAGLAALPAAERRRIGARLALIRAEAKALFADFDGAAAQAQEALQEMLALGDMLGCADTHWLKAMIANELGDRASECVELERAAHYAGMADPVRCGIAHAATAMALVFTDLEGARSHWAEHLGAAQEQARSPSHPALLSWSDSFQGLAALVSNDCGSGIEHFLRAHAHALSCGQIKRAINAATNIGVGFINLNDLASALEWTELGLKMARKTAWPRSVGVALMQFAGSLRQARRYEAARPLLDEALQLLAPMQASRQYALAMNTLAEVELACGDHAAALERFRSVEQRARVLGQKDLKWQALLGQARALLTMGQGGPAMEAARAARDAAQTRPVQQVETYQLMAEIERAHPQPLLPGMKAGSAALYFFHLALDVAADIEGYTVPSDLLEAMAREYANDKDFLRAHQYGQQAIAALKQAHDEDFTKRSIAMHVTQQTERTRAEGEHLRQLAKVQAERADSLSRTNAILEQLGSIGRLITGNLDAQAVFSALDRHVHELLDAPSFFIFRLNDDGQSLGMVFGVESGELLGSFEIAVDDPRSHVAYCARERQVLVIDGEGTGVRLPGTAGSASLLFAPLLQGERLLGVLTVQSPRPHAYGEHERAIFHTLCAYGAIALANAEALQRQRQAQALLIQQEKMASLGQLVASVAHEINTPLGAIKSSGKSIAEALDHALENLPRLLQRIEGPVQALFIQLIDGARQSTELLSMREERAAIRSLSEQLTQAGIGNVRITAGLLVQLHAQHRLEQVLPLLRHAEAELMLATAQSVAAILSCSGNINDAVERVGKIVFALKSYSRVDASGAMHPTDLRQSLETVLTIYQHQLRQGTELVRRYEELPPLLGLPDELNQVWTNLIHNALQAMGHQGVLTIGLHRDGDTAVVSIGDSGCGIPEAIRARIFEPFFTTKPIGEGSGIGLDIVRKIVDKHGGRIEVDSQEGVGTTFFVRLPLTSIADGTPSQ
ncbi:ATP-binding protein [Roseateles oligotrophus]|uniref:histidine kinase n=1 Tax=Roseateles oligotrophus TaxID=1769250 RepID=A0ABT2YGB7_9BURK|nr:ATP-binding protein [Roseateles oligotrophus]MCV2369092.1 GAF domain-containing protein [Roseateles oligotrophus]